MADPITIDATTVRQPDVVRTRIGTDLAEGELVLLMKNYMPVELTFGPGFVRLISVGHLLETPRE